MKLSKHDISDLLTPKEIEMAQVLNEDIRRRTSTNQIVDVAPLMAVAASVSLETYTEYPFADIVATKVGNEFAPFGKMTFVENGSSNGFAAGIINNGSKESNLARVDSVLTDVQAIPESWVKTVDYTIAEIEGYNKLGDYSLVAAKERLRKLEWDKGIAQVAIQGLNLGSKRLQGLTTIAGVTTNTAVFGTTSLASMNATELAAVASGVATAYQAVNKYQSIAKYFVLPFEVYTAMAAPYNPAGASLETKIDVLTRSLRIALMSPELEIVGAPIERTFGAGNNKDRYVLTPYDENVALFDICYNYRPTSYETSNGFHFTSSGIGQFYGVTSTRPNRMVYFDAVQPA